MVKLEYPIPAQMKTRYVNIVTFLSEFSALFFAARQVAEYHGDAVQLSSNCTAYYAGAFLYQPSPKDHSNPHEYISAQICFAITHKKATSRNKPKYISISSVR